MQIQINWLVQKPTDPDLHCLQRQGKLHCLQRQGISELSRTKVKLICTLFHIISEHGRYIGKLKGSSGTWVLKERVEYCDFSNLHKKGSEYLLILQQNSSSWQADNFPALSLVYPSLSIYINHTTPFWMLDSQIIYISVRNYSL